MSLPHLTWLLRERRSLTLETPGGVELEAHLDALDPFRNRISLRLEAPSPPVDPGDLLRLSFGFAGQRWSARVPLHHFPNRSLFVVGAPKAFEAADRRAHPRWIPDVPTGEVVLRTALGEGWELRGGLRSLSEGGVALEVRTATGPRGEEERAGARLLAKGQSLPVVTLALAEGPTLELEGWVAWVAGDQVGLRLRGLVASGRERLRAYLGGRLTPGPELLPAVPEPEAAPDPEVALLPEAPPPPRERNAALRRLKRRGRTVAVAMRAGRAREALLAYLEAEGFGAVFAVESLAQWLEPGAHRSPDVVFIDGGVKELQGLALASFLQQSRGGRTFALVLAQGGPGGVSEALARQAGVDRLVEKPYGLEAPLLEALDEALALSQGRAAPAAASEAAGPPLLLVMAPGPEREALEAFLAGAGGFQVRAAGSLGEVVRALRAAAPALLLVDWEEAGLTSTELAAFLAGPAGGCPQVAVVPRGTPPPAAPEALHQLPRPYALDAALLARLRRSLGPA